MMGFYTSAKAKINYFERQVLVQYNILQFDVPMSNGLLVHVF